MPLLSQSLLLLHELKLLGELRGLPLCLLSKLPLCPPKFLLKSQFHGLKLVLVGKD